MREEEIHELLNRETSVHTASEYQREVTKLLNKRGEDTRLNRWEADKLKFYEEADISSEILVSVIVDHRNVMW